jgi:hypothetical protein
LANRTTVARTPQLLRLEERCRQLEGEKEGIISGLGEASAPLLKQIESMAAAAAATQVCRLRALGLRVWGCRVWGLRVLV